MTSPQALLAALLTDLVPLAIALRDAFLHSFQSYAHPICPSSLHYHALKQKFRKLDATVANFYVITIVDACINIASFKSKKNFTRPRIAEMIWDSTNSLEAILLFTVAQGALEPPMLAIIDKIVDLLDKTNLPAILERIAIDRRPKSYGNAMAQLILAFAAAYDLFSGHESARKANITH
jgi:hypothetical protein